LNFFYSEAYRASMSCASPWIKSWASDARYGKWS